MPIVVAASRAMEYITAAIAHTPTVEMLYILKGRIHKVWHGTLRQCRGGGGRRVGPLTCQSMSL